MEVRDSISLARANGWGSSAPGKDEEEGADDDDENLALIASNLVSLGHSHDVGSEGRVKDEEGGSEKTASSQRSSERDSIFNADNEGAEDESSSESEDEGEVDEGVIG
jgi:hypothetical protein